MFWLNWTLASDLGCPGVYWLYQSVHVYYIIAYGCMNYLFWS